MPTTLGILHLTIYTKRLATLDVRELGGPNDGQVRARSLRWPAERPYSPHGHHAVPEDARAGHDFVVLDARTAALDLTPERRRVIADRRLGVGCDHSSCSSRRPSARPNVFMRIYNPDGGEAQACGNATRCVASVVMDERKTDQVTVQTVAGLLESQKSGVGSNGCR